MTPTDLDTLEALLNAATPGAWVDVGHTDLWPGIVMAVEEHQSMSQVCRDPECDDRPADRACIAALHNAAPDLIRAAREAIRLADALAEAEATIANERGEGEAPGEGWAYVDIDPHACRIQEFRDWRTWFHEDSGAFLHRRNDGTGYRLGRLSSLGTLAGGVVSGPVYKYARAAMRAAIEANKEPS